MNKEYLQQYRDVLKRTKDYRDDIEVYLYGSDLDTLISALEELIAIYEKDV